MVQTNKTNNRETPNNHGRTRSNEKRPNKEASKIKTEQEPLGENSKGKRKEIKSKPPPNLQTKKYPIHPTNVHQRTKQKRSCKHIRHKIEDAKDKIKLPQNVQRQKMQMVRYRPRDPRTHTDKMYHIPTYIKPHKIPKNNDKPPQNDEGRGQLTNQSDGNAPRVNIVKPQQTTKR